MLHHRTPSERERREGRASGERARIINYSRKRSPSGNHTAIVERFHGRLRIERCSSVSFGAEIILIR